MYATLFDDPDLGNQMLHRYLAVTADDIRAVAADVLRADNRVVLTYLPEEQRGDAVDGRESSEATESESADESEEVAA